MATAAAAVVLALGLLLPSARPRSLQRDDRATMTDNNTWTSEGCLTNGGTQLKVGETVLAVKPDACYINECTRQGLQAIVVYCPPLRCKRYHKPAGACCPFCSKRCTGRLSSEQTPAANTSKITSAINTSTARSNTNPVYTIIDEWSTSQATTTTATGTSTPDPTCVTEDGRQLSVGDSVMDVVPGACYVQECTSEGLFQLVGDCLPPSCVDYLHPERECCPFCPNGQNCRLPSGEVIKEPVERDGLICQCPEQELEIGPPSDSYFTAICTPVSTSPDRTSPPPTSTTTSKLATSTQTRTTANLTTSSPTPRPTQAPTTTMTRTTSRTTTTLTCITEDGKRLNVGESAMKLEPGACYISQCTPQGLVVMVGDCGPPMCVDYVQPQGECCPYCPNGQNCRLPSGRIITAPVVEGCLRCECPQEPEDIFSAPDPIYYTAICYPVVPPSTSRTTTPLFTAITRTSPRITTPKGCVTDTGKSLAVGQSVTELLTGSCRTCECTLQGLSCIYGDCFPPMCVDYLRDNCCYRCPNGQNCRLPSGEVITTPVEREGTRCECPRPATVMGPPSDRYTTAICTTISTTSTQTRTTANLTTSSPTPRPTQAPTTTTARTTFGTTTTLTCITEDGKRLNVGESAMKLEPGACYISQCTPQGLVVMVGDCGPPMCVDYVQPQDECCPYCPNGQNCRLPSGRIITAPVVEDGLRCECPQDPETFSAPDPIYYTAICNPV